MYGSPGASPPPILGLAEVAGGGGSDETNRLSSKVKHNVVRLDIRCFWGLLAVYYVALFQGKRR